MKATAAPEVVPIWKLKIKNVFFFFFDVPIGCLNRADLVCIQCGNSWGSSYVQYQHRTAKKFAGLQFGNLLNIVEGVLKNSSSTNEKVGAVRHKKNALF